MNCVVNNVADPLFLLIPSGSVLKLYQGPRGIPIFFYGEAPLRAPNRYPLIYYFSQKGYLFHIASIQNLLISHTFFFFFFFLRTVRDMFENPLILNNFITVPSLAREIPIFL